MSFLTGFKKRLLFHSDTNGFTICLFKIKSKSDDIDEDTLKRALKDDQLVVKGHFMVPNNDIEYKFYGEFVTDQKFGLQYNVTKMELCKINDNEALINYLSSDMFEGIGLVSATKIVEALGLNAVEIIKNNEDALNDIIPGRKGKVLRRTLIDNARHEDVLILLHNFGFSSFNAMKILKFYDENIKNVLTDNPYKIADDVPNVGFETIDELALRNNINVLDRRRVKALMKYTLRKVANKIGYTYLTKSQLFNETHLYLKNDDFTKRDFKDYLDELIDNEEVVEEGDKIYDKIIHICEVNIANKIKKIVQHKDKLFNEDIIQTIEDKLGIQYESNQRNAIKCALSERAFVLTGGPGTGKTTVVRGILEGLYLSGYDKIDIALLAPTGKAAKRLKEQTNLDAMTIHRYLGYDGEGFEKNEDNLTQDRVIIVDESSMMDIYLCNQLLKSIQPHAKLIIVGDDDQLPSVGPGQVLKDIIDSGVMTVNKLTKIHRQSEGSDIVKLAHGIREGILHKEVFEHKKDTSFIPSTRDTFEDRLNFVISAAIKKGYSLDDIQILAPMYKTEGVGINSINEIIQKSFNKDAPREIKVRDHIFKVGDRVIQTVNRVSDGVMNGDVGYILDIEFKHENADVEDYIKVSYDETIVTYRRSEFIELTLAYGISVHKSQGSEYPIIILPVFNAFKFMLKRKLVYTAVTRAKKSLIIIGDINAFESSVSTIEEDRQSTLISRLIDLSSFETPKKENKRIDDPSIPFDELGEEMEDISPYDFM